MRRLFIAVATFSLVMSGTAWAELQKQDRDELFQRIDHMCRDASSVGEVVTYEGSLDAGATLKVVGLGATGKVTKEQWKNIEQKYGEFRATPTICNIEMFKLILPLFGEAPTCAPGVLKTIGIQQMPTLDGNNNVVGNISGAVVSIVRECPSPNASKDKVRFSYGYYNGSGTWRGEQHMVLVLKSAQGGPIFSQTYGIDRSRCWYGKPQTFVVEGDLGGGVGPLVETADLSISPVTGTQTGC